MRLELHQRMALPTLSMVLVGFACGPASGPGRLATTPASSPELEDAQASDCHLDGSTADWIREIFHSWIIATETHLEIEPEPLPNGVLFDTSCAWYVGPATARWLTDDVTLAPLDVDGLTVELRGRRHRGTIALPDGRSLPAEIIAVSMPHRSEPGVAFLVLALPELWRDHERAGRDPHLEARLRGVALHEMIHERQLPVLRAHIRKLGEHRELPAKMDDDVLENRFGDLPEYRRTIEREIDLLYEALATSDEPARSDRIKEALALARLRHSNFLVGSDAVYRDLDGLFLNMEGVAEWLRFEFHRSDPAWPVDTLEITTFMRGRGNSWVQDEGLALLLLLEAVGVDWRRAMLGPRMESPVRLLAHAMGLEW